jgi:hypothetical protein
MSDYVKITEDNIGTYLALFDKAIEKSLEACGLQAETYAKSECPVDTGRLRNSITHGKKDKSTEMIGTNVEYAEEVETNEKMSHKVGNAHFLRNSVRNHTDEYRNIFNNALKNA